MDVLVELSVAIRARRMCRDFTDEAVAPDLVDRLLDLARRAPSGGYTQGYDFLVLEGPDQTGRYWDRTLSEQRRATFSWPGLLRAPVLVLPLAHSQAYVDRYAQPDKVHSGLGAGEAAWPVPYWHIDTAMATQNLLLAVVDAGLGALFFGIFGHEAELMADFGVPAGRQPIGTVAIGHPTEAARAIKAEGSVRRRPRRSLGDLVHRGGW